MKYYGYLSNYESNFTIFHYYNYFQDYYYYFYYRENIHDYFFPQNHFKYFIYLYLSWIESITNLHFKTFFLLFVFLNIDLIFCI